MATLKSFAIVAALLAGGTAMAIAQNGPATSAPSGATKQNCAGIRHGLTECSKTQKSAASRGVPQTASSSAKTQTAASAATPMHGSDTVILSAAQRRTVWNDLGKQATNQKAAGFEATTGTFVPNTVKVKPVPGKVAANVPSLRPYGFAMVDHSLVIVDPTNKVIADVVTKPSAQPRSLHHRA
jgi:hypothetical protein